ncbi:MAG: 30S ribosome-binding factor RbfA [Candidatus Omnitrophota bacterium]
MSLRMERINSELRKQLMKIIRHEVDDPALDFLSITRVETTADLQESKVFFSLLDDSQYKKAKDVLGSMRGFIRGILGKNIRLKFLPQLNFIPDNSIKYSVDLYKTIEKVKEEEDASEDYKEDSGQDS